MTSKIKNNASQYLTRSVLGGAPVDRSADTPPPARERQRAEAVRRDAKGVLDQRWYIQLPPKR
jgi:hypothetical protein